MTREQGAHLRQAALLSRLFQAVLGTVTTLGPAGQLTVAGSVCDLRWQIVVSANPSPAAPNASSAPDPPPPRPSRTDKRRHVRAARPRVHGRAPARLGIDHETAHGYDT